MRSYDPGEAIGRFIEKPTVPRETRAFKWISGRVIYLLDPQPFAPAAVILTWLPDGPRSPGNRVFHASRIEQVASRVPEERAGK